MLGQSIFFVLPIVILSILPIFEKYLLINVHMQTLLLVFLLFCSYSMGIAQTPCAEPVATIVERDGQLSTDKAYSAYQWLMDGQAITGATERNYTPTRSGSYTVVVKARSEDFFFQATGIGNQAQASLFNLTPNPTNGKFTLQFETGIGETADVTVFDLSGRVVFEQTVSTRLPQPIDLGTPTLGMYVVNVRQGQAQQTLKMIIE
jgi:hypothetical protein